MYRAVEAVEIVVLLITQQKYSFSAYYGAFLPNNLINLGIKYCI